MPSSVYSCVHAHLPQVQWARRRWVTRSYTFKGRDACVLSGPRTEAAVRSLKDLANDLLHVRLPCHEPGHSAVQVREGHEDHLHLPHTGVGPTQLDHVWFRGLQALFKWRMPSPLAHRLLHPVRHKKSGKRTRQTTTGDTLWYAGIGMTPGSGLPRAIHAVRAAGRLDVLVRRCLPRSGATGRSGVNPPAYATCRGWP